MMQIPLVRRLALVVATSALVAAGVALHTTGAAEPAGTPEAAVKASGENARPPLVEQVPSWQACRPVPYAGPGTRLYRDRPYHTEAAVPALAGHAFCPGLRHGRASWLLDVTRPTTLHTVATEAYGLEQVGWRRLEAPVHVAAAGVSFDRLYALEVAPGRYLIHQGHAPSSIPVFWNPRDVRAIGPPARR